MSSTVEQIKDRLSIVDVVGQYVKLTKAGKNYKGLSPFKKEKTPSFYVQPDKGMYYDFSTNQGGDIFTFVQAMDGLDFQGALHLLAERAGVTVERESKEKRDIRTRLYDACEDACKFFETKLEEQKEALAYLRERGLEDGIRRRFRLGFAPDGWQGLQEHLTAAGYSVRELEQAGLAKKGERGSTYDRFRSRIMFPLADSAGRVIAFSGRIFGKAAEDSENAKYLNSPETTLFDKGRVLYGYDKAKSHIRKYDFAIFVEGQMDLVLSHQAGYTNTVAVSGTGLTAHHIELVRRLTNHIVLAFDADSAGVQSTGRAALLALARGMDVKVARVPTGKDPADCIRDDVAAWKGAVKSAVHVIDYFLTYLDEKAKDSRAYELAVRDTVLPYVARIQSGVDRAHFVRRISNKLGLPEDAVREDLGRAQRRIEQDAEKSVIVRELPQVAAPQAAHPLAQPPSRLQNLERSIAGLLFWQSEQRDSALTEQVLEKETLRLGLSLSDVLARYAAEKEVLSLQAQIVYEQEQHIVEAATELLKDLARERVRHELAILMRDIKAAEQRSEDTEAQTLLARFTELSRELEALD